MAAALLSAGALAAGCASREPLAPRLASPTAAAGCASAPREAPAAGRGTGELRGAWITSVDSPILDSRAQVEGALARLAALRFNAVFPVAWNKGALFFAAPDLERALGPSPFLPEALRGRDALAEVLAGARRSGLRVVPWFEYGLALPASMPMVAAHPGWFLRGADGALGAAGDPLPLARLNPLHPEAAAFLIALFTAPLEREGVEAIQLDDHFAIPPALDRDETTARLYRGEHASRAPPADPRDPAWMRWRANRFSAFVHQLAQAVHARGKRLSLAPNPARAAYASGLQDWPAWVRAGDVDELVLQLYRRDLVSFRHELDQPELAAARACAPLAVGLLAGVAGSPPPADDVLRGQLDEARARGLQGAVFFHAASLLARPPLLEALAASSRAP